MLGLPQFSALFGQAYGFQTLASGHGISVGAGNFQHVQFWAPNTGATNRRYVVHQIAMAISNEGAAAPAGALNAVNVHRHGTALANAGQAHFTDVQFSATACQGQIRFESAAAPLGTLGQMLMSIPLAPVVAQNAVPAVVGMAPQSLVLPVCWRGSFDGTMGITFVTQDPTLGLHVAVWWAEYRANT